MYINARRAIRSTRHVSDFCEGILWQLHVFPVAQVQRVHAQKAGHRAAAVLDVELGAVLHVGVRLRLVEEALGLARERGALGGRDPQVRRAGVVDHLELGGGGAHRNRAEVLGIPEVVDGDVGGVLQSLFEPLRLVLVLLEEVLGELSFPQRDRSRSAPPEGEAVEVV